MRALVVYESMFGNTHEVAERIGTGLRSDPDLDVEVISVSEAVTRVLTDVDLVVVGGPTHAHGMSRGSSRAAAMEQATKEPDLDLDPSAVGPGLRDWFHALPRGQRGAAAAYDTRVDGPEMLTGHASRGVARQLVRHGFVLMDEPVSFLVDRTNHLLHGEADRAEEWGEALAALLERTALADR